MSKQGANEAYNDIMQKVDEVFILAQSHLAALKKNGGSISSSKSRKSTSSSSCSTTTSSSISNTSSRSQSTIKPTDQIRLKTQSYRSLDKKKAMIVTKMKGIDQIDESKIRQVEQLVASIFEQKPETLKF